MRAGQPPEVKETPVLRPPGQPSDSGDGAGADYRWLWMTLLALLILALAVIFGLPRVVVPVAQTEMPAPAPVSTGDSEAQRAAANQALQRYLQLRAGLALDNADAWGEPDWSEAAGLASAADRYFAERRFALAARDYQAALDRLQQLDAGRADMLTEALDAGVRALAENDVDTAIARFEAALRIAPDHPDAERGLVQARNRGASLEHMDLGMKAELENDLEAARETVEFAESSVKEFEEGIAKRDAVIAHQQKNVEKMKLDLCEPLRELFKDEVREVGATMGMPKHVLWRQPLRAPPARAESACRVAGRETSPVRSLAKESCRHRHRGPDPSGPKFLQRRWGSHQTPEQ